MERGGEWRESKGRNQRLLITDETQVTIFARERKKRSWKKQSENGETRKRRETEMNGRVKKSVRDVGGVVRPDLIGRGRGRQGVRVNEKRKMKEKERTVKRLITFTDADRVACENTHRLQRESKEQCGIK